jgi:hypothetical protein
VSVDYLTLKMTFEEPITPSEIPCDLCAKQGYLLKCLHKSCKKHVHAFCVFEQQRRDLQDVDMQEGSSSEEDNIDGWQVELKFQDYARQRFQSNQELVKSDL